MTASETSYFWHFKRLMVLGIPLVLGQILQIAIGVTDSSMVGRLGELPLAQIGLGSQFVFFIVLAPVGMSIAVSVKSAQALVTEDYHAMKRATQAGIWLHLIAFLLLLPLMWESDQVLRMLGQPEPVIEGAAAYVRVLIIAIPFAYISSVLRSYLVALERANEMLVVAFLGFLFNIAANYVLIYGALGVPGYGLIGSAIASVLTNIFMCIAVIWLALREEASKSVDLFGGWRAIKARELAHMAWLGIPMSLGVIAEVGMFQFATIMMGWISVTALAAHTIVMNMASLTFMIPLGLSIAASVRAGNALGRRDRDGMIKGAVVAYWVVTLIMVVTAISFWLIPDLFVALFQDSSRDDAAQVAQIAVVLFMGAAAFQIFDGAQIVGMSLLRGVQDVQIPSLLAVFSYWGVGVSMGYALGFPLGLDGLGIWLGLASGLFVASVLLAWRFIWQMRPENFARLVANAERDH